MRVPWVIGRLFAGEAGMIMMTMPGASNAKAKRELDGVPRTPAGGRDCRVSVDVTV